MTHSLHRIGKTKSLEKDYVVMSFGSPRNSGGLLSAAKLLLRTKTPGLFKLLMNIYEHTGIRSRRIAIAKLMQKSENHNPKEKNKNRGPFVLNSGEELCECLKKLKQANNGRSVVVSGLIGDVTDCLKSIDLLPHTVQYSLGYFGKKELLPRKKILEITTMCGHHMISPKLVEKLEKDIKSKKISAEEASQQMARLCVCGIFNKERASNIMAGI